MMFTSTNDLEDPLYFMDPYNSSIPSPLSYFEFDYGSILEWDNTSQPLVDEPISTTSQLVLSAGDINGMVPEQDKGTSLNNGSNKKAVSKRGPSKGDRHSKVPTAHGLRDRRMRLSLDVARQFFKVQDMLSYDKASKTVKWLLQQAKSAIEELNKGKKSPCTYEGEVVESAIADHEIVNVVPKVGTFKEKGRQKRKNERRPVAKPVRKKLREEARERARERTQKKMHDRRLNELGGCVDEVMGLRGLRNESADSQTQILNPCSDVVLEIQQQIDDERITFGTTLAVTTTWRSLMSLSYHQEEDSCQVNPIPEFQQFHGTSREFYSLPNLGQR